MSKKDNKPFLHSEKNVPCWTTNVQSVVQNWSYLLLISVFSGCLIRTSNVHSVVLSWTYLLSISGSVVGPSSPTHTTLSSFSPSLDKGEAGKSTWAVTGEGGGDFSHTSGISENIKQHLHSLLLRRKGKLSITVSVCALLFVQIID